MSAISSSLPDYETPAEDLSTTDHDIDVGTPVTPLAPQLAPLLSEDSFEESKKYLESYLATVATPKPSSQSVQSTPIPLQHGVQTTPKFSPQGVLDRINVDEGGQGAFTDTRSATDAPTGPTPGTESPLLSAEIHGMDTSCLGETEHAVQFDVLDLELKFAPAEGQGSDSLKPSSALARSRENSDAQGEISSCKAYITNNDDSQLNS